MKKFTHPPLRRTLVLSGLAALAFGAVAVGGTYALFTSSAETNVTVTTGKVSVKSELKNLVAKSPASISSDGTINKTADTDEDGYITGENGTFVNGGSATIEGNKVILNNITPGDLVEFDLEITNDSTVDIKHRTLFNQVTPDGVDNLTSKELAASMNIKAGEKDMTGIVEYRSAWEKLAVGEGNKTIHFVIELPATVSASQGASTDFSFVIEAVQSNAATEGDEFVSKYTTASSVSDIQAALNNISSGEGATVTLSEDVDFKSGVIDVSKGVANLDLNGKKIVKNSTSSNYILQTSSGGEITISNGSLIGETGNGGTLAIVNGGSKLNLENVVIDASKVSGAAALAVWGDGAEVNVDGGEIKSSIYGITTNGYYTTGGKMVFNGTKIDSWCPIYLPGNTDVELNKCVVNGYTIICGGTTKINGGTYTHDMGTDKFETNYGSYTKDKPNSNGLYLCKTNEDKYYFDLQSTYNYYSGSTGAGCVFDTITIIENRQGSYKFGSVEIDGANVEIANKPGTDHMFGIRYVDASDATKYKSNNVTITNCETKTADTLYSADFFKELA